MDFGILASGLGGIVTGLVGPIAKGVVALKQQKAQFEHDEKMVELTTQATIAEAQAAIQKVETITEGQVKVAEVGALTEAVKAADRPIFNEVYMKYLIKAGRFGQIVAGLVAFGLACVDMLRQAIRPVVTVYMIGASTWVTVLAYQVLQAVDKAIEPSFAQDLFKMAVYTVVYLTVTVVNFWFVNREKGMLEKIAKKIK